MQNKNIFNFDITQSIDFVKFISLPNYITPHTLKNLTLPRKLLKLYNEPKHSIKVFLDGLDYNSSIIEIAFLKLQKYKHDITLLNRNLVIMWTIINYNKYIKSIIPKKSNSSKSGFDYDIYFSYLNLSLFIKFNMKSDDFYIEIFTKNENKTINETYIIEITPNLSIPNDFAVNSTSKLFSANYLVRYKKTISIEYNLNDIKKLEFGSNYLYEIPTTYNYRQCNCITNYKNCIWLKNNNMYEEFYNKLKSKQLDPTYRINNKLIHKEDFFRELKNN